MDKIISRAFLLVSIGASIYFGTLSMTLLALIATGLFIAEKIWFKEPAVIQQPSEDLKLQAQIIELQEKVATINTVMNITKVGNRRG